jgi:uncharacterized protein YndB with AHSA1/START domain
MAANPLTVHQVYQIQSSVTSVFRALTEPAELTKWFLVAAQVAPRKGGRYEFTWRGGYHHAGTVLEFVRNRRFCLTWPGPTSKMTRVTFSFRRVGTGTRLEVRHTGFGHTPAWLENYGGTSSGWAYFLMNLKSVLEHGHDLRTRGDLI